ncbi:GGDEF domain-containing protein [Sphingomonas koreensis]|uniref:GGDEF domain-containing protein n=1 Tax=Sphingomonas koreensis TaxID=93064 RepID=UPI00082CFD91|nr:GGDEF domain-containing protein [Sphingomonas koreensis]PJI88739.1 diguanylate cyclase [Sphingomonas koreensis]RSU63651.1 GGDEF domain-containing protein [Sphingomonas koreensis]RSU69291.1 GGDEF domain-containing protein [Sphingomonas koreensis]
MTVARAARTAAAADPAWQLFERIGTFLADQRLEPDPANFAFAWHLLHDSDGPLARAVAALTDGGVRLTKRDIESLGVDSPASARSVRDKADGLVAQTQMQVEGFQDMVQAMRHETAGFGRDLAASANAIRRYGSGTEGALFDELSRVTATMLERVHNAESRLENATREATELRDKLEEARDNARRDPLTELPNRRAFEEAYAELAAAGAGMCVALCDVDHFKGVNDRFGHAVGDRVLKTIAETLKACCGGHLVARYGGEEFAILFAATGLESARVTLDNARATVAAKRYRLRETDAPLGEITFSAGLTLVADGESLGTSVGRADRLLYAAKKDGRNCVHAS